MKTKTRRRVMAWFLALLMITGLLPTEMGGGVFRVQAEESPVIAGDATVPAGTLAGGSENPAGSLPGAAGVTEGAQLEGTDPSEPILPNGTEADGGSQSGGAEAIQPGGTGTDGEVQPDGAGNSGDVQPGRTQTTTDAMAADPYDIRAGESGGDVYELNADDVMAAGISSTSGDTPAGTGNYFTLTSTLLIDASKKTFTVDGQSITINNRIKSGGDGSDIARSIRFTVSAGKTARVAVCMASSSSSADAQLILYSVSDKQQVPGTDAVFVGKGVPTVGEFTDLPAGEYYLASTKGTDITGAVNYYYIKVVEENAVTPPTVDTVTAAQDPSDATGATVTVSFTGTAGEANSRYVIEASKDGGANWVKVDTYDGTATSGNVTVNLNQENLGYGSWQFRVTGVNSVTAGDTIDYIANTYVLSGTYTGLGGDADKLSALVFEPTTDSTYVIPDATLNNGSYSIELEKGTTYKVSAEGVNDYAITDPAEAFTYSEDTTLNLVFSKKPTYGVKIALGSTPDLSSKNVVFIFKHSEGDVYSFTDRTAVSLRSGTYEVSLGGDFEQLPYTMATGTSLTVSDREASLNITFKPATTWSFTGATGYSDSIQKGSGKETGYYQGLYIDTTNGGKLAPNGSGASVNSAQFNEYTKISVPVTGPCTVSVTAYQPQYALYTIGGTPASTTEDTSSYEYTGTGQGTVDIVSTGNAYITGISVVYAAVDVPLVEQTVMPFVPEDDTDANTALDTDNIPRASKKSSLTVQPVGQKLNFVQTGGNFNNLAENTSNVGYYLFPMTEDHNRLEFDVVITGNTGTSNQHGFFGGLFTNNYIYTLGLRGGGIKLRGVYTKNTTLSGDGSFAGAGSPAEESVGGLNVPIHYVIEYDGTKANVTITFTNAEGVQTRNFTQGKLSESETRVYFGFALSAVSATVTNMKYTAEDGTVLYDQNSCYYPMGSTPVAASGSVAALAADSREYIDITWEGTLPEDDGTYVVEMQKDGGEWVELADDVTDFTYRYNLPAGDGGSYLFRVCGQLGRETLGGTRNSYVTMDTPVSVVGALEKPVVSITAAASQISLDWQDVAGAEYYLVYRYSFDETEAASAQVAKVTDSEYADTDVSAEMPYYYNVKAVSETADNESPLSDTVWQVATPGHSGAYVYEREATEIILTRKSYDTVFDGNVVLEGIVDGVGTLQAYVNGTAVPAAAKEIQTARDSFSFTLTVEEGRNNVELIFTDAGGAKTRKAYNFVYLTNYDIIVDADYTGVDGQADSANGNELPVYKTVGAAVDAASAGDIIFVKAGSYEERLVVSKADISIIGEDRESTSIHCYPGTLGSAYEAGGDMDKRCATYIQSGAAGFSAENITFANDYVYGTPDGKSNKSADAFRCDADGVSFVNVKFSGVQDTLYIDAGKQYYNKCRIEGLVDFIYSGNNARAFFNDCEIVFVYESTKTSGYVSAPRTAADADYGLTFNDCVIFGEEGCNGTGYLLARPWGPDAYITWINCYMGQSVNARAPYGAMSGNAHEDARFFEFGTYGPGFAINPDRRQISPSAAANMISDSYLGWSPAAVSGAVGESYVGSVTTDREPGFVDKDYQAGTYAWTDGDDTGLKLYDMEGYAEGYGVSGGGLLLETNDNYYTVGTAAEFLDALVAVKSSGKNSVIELTNDISLGCYEVENFDSYAGTISAYSAQALTHPRLKETGVSILRFDNLHNLTIFSQNGSSILHANITMKNSSNIVIRNIKFDELWEWDEATAGDYDRNDWDYMTIDSGCDGIWIDHCTFYKAYDGVIDVKNPNPLERVTISWCEFLPGSEGDVFFKEMMDYVYAHPEEFPSTYQHMKEEGMSDEQVYMYAYGQKKTHLLGQSDDAVNAVGIQVTLANNYYKDSMDRMPRLRYGDSHVYNCIMDAQDLLDAKNGIANEDIAKKIVSNGAASTCGGHVLLENCYISGIMNALNSGNGASPSGYINAINSVYYMNGIKTVLEPKCNTTGDTRVLVTDPDAFIGSLPYSGYYLYDAETLDQVVIPRAGAGKITLTVLQWEKTSYNAEYQAPEVTDPEPGPVDPEPVFKGEFSQEFPEKVLQEVEALLPQLTSKEKIVEYMTEAIVNSEAQKILPNITMGNILVGDVTIKIRVVEDGVEIWKPVENDSFPEEGVDVLLDYPQGTNMTQYDFVVAHLMLSGDRKGEIEYLAPTLTEEGLVVHVNGASPFAVRWERKPDSNEPGEDPDEKPDEEPGSGDNNVKDDDDDSSQTLPKRPGTSPKTYDDGSFTSMWQSQLHVNGSESNSGNAGENSIAGGANGLRQGTQTTAAAAATALQGRVPVVGIAIAVIAAALIASGVLFFRRKKDEAE